MTHLRWRAQQVESTDNELAHCLQQHPDRQLLYISDKAVGREEPSPTLNSVRGRRRIGLMAAVLTVIVVSWSSY